jgi:hypothetical protein
VDPPSGKPFKERGTKPTPVHGSQHAGDKPVNTPTLLHKRHKSAYPAFVVDGLIEVGENHSLE